MKKIFLFISLAVSITAANAQVKQSPAERKKQERKDRTNMLIKKYEEGALIYSKQSAFGFKLNTDGWGAFYEHGKYKTLINTNLWWAEVGEHHDPSEERHVAASDQFGFAIGNPYSFGKINNFYAIKLGIGQQKLIGGKGNKNGVAVSAVYGGGLAMGYLKPYYLNVLDSTNNQIDVKYSAENDYLFKSGDISTGGDIIGASGFTKGLSEGKFTPGVFARASLRFDYGRYNEFLSALETGINAEFYSQKMPIMINRKEKQFFFNAYIAIEFGRRK